MTNTKAQATDLQHWQGIVTAHQKATREAVSAAARGEVGSIALSPDLAEPLQGSGSAYATAGASLARVEGVTPQSDEEKLLATTHLLILYGALAELAGKAALIEYNPLIEKAYWWFVVLIVLFFGWTIFKSGVNFDGVAMSSLMFAVGTVFGIGVGHWMYKRRAAKMAAAVRETGKQFGIDLDPVADTPEKLAELLKPVTFELTRLGDQSFRLPMKELRAHIADVAQRHDALIAQHS